MSFDLDGYLARQRARVEAALVRVVEDGAAPARLREAIGYSLLDGGKRLRPILVLASCEAVGGQAETALPAACALEMIHTYSLVHDDLPCMDNDDFRRGRPTSHRKYGEALAVLVGDALLTDAFSVAAQAQAPAAVVIAVLQELAQAAGSGGMVGGQVLDVELTGKSVGLEELTQLHRLKTGALLRAAVRTGALLGGASADSLERLTRFGEALGLAFQIIDDVLDVTADLQTLGKDPGSDRDAGKTTFVNLLGVDGAQRHAQAVMARGLEALAPLGEAAEPLRALGRYTVDRKH
ncbi:MAG: polyprenyl synthetase family protein [Myxococcales bacterium]|nr:polyprenyl synthetase family protein [Myxococcota bacterium]MDW8282409.1 polyprenyl synthetase family protein [Myxococcales bacterium]